jgi:hypothetical protein
VTQPGGSAPRSTRRFCRHSPDWRLRAAPRSPRTEPGTCWPPCSATTALPARALSRWNHTGRRSSYSPAAATGSARYDRHRTMAPGSSASLYTPPVFLMTAGVSRQSGLFSGLVSITTTLGEPGDAERPAPRSHRRHEMRLLYFRMLRANHSPDRTPEPPRSPRSARNTGNTANRRPPSRTAGQRAFSLTFTLQRTCSRLRLRRTIQGQERKPIEGGTRWPYWRG